MKNDRHQKILELIAAYPIERQEDLLQKLNENGFSVTQATVSRDIRQLQLIKVSNGDGHYRYVKPGGHLKGSKPSRFEMIWSESVLSVDYAGYTTIVKCSSGMANAACEVFDLMEWENVAGTIAGENVIFIQCRTVEAAAALAEELKKYIH